MSGTEPPRKPPAEAPKAPAEPPETPKKKSNDWIPKAVLGVTLIPALVVGLLVIFAGGSSENPSEATSAEASASSSELVSLEPGTTLEQVKDKYESYSYEDFAQLATPAQDHSQGGQFISRKVNGLSPPEKLDAILRYSAEDPITLIGFSQTYMPGLFSAEALRKVREGGQQSQLRYEIWSALRDRFTGSANVADTKLNGTWYNTSVSDNGQISAVKTEWNNEPGTKLELAAVSARGKSLPAEDAYMRDLCANRQTKQPPTGMVTITPPGSEEPGPGPEPEPGPEHPGGGGEAPPTTVTETPPPTEEEQPKRDTPANTKGPAGNGKPQPVSETEPPGTEAGNAPPPTEGATKPYEPAPVKEAGPVSEPTPTEDTKVEPTDNW